MTESNETVYWHTHAADGTPLTEPIECVTGIKLADLQRLFEEVLAVSAAVFTWIARSSLPPGDGSRARSSSSPICSACSRRTPTSESE